MSAKLFEAALGIAEPWFIQGVDFDTGKKMLTIGIDFIAGSRFAMPGVEGLHPVHDTVTKRYRHLNFFQHECHLEVRVPRVRLPDGGIRQVEPDWAGRLAGFTLLFEALIMAMCREMTFAAVSRLVGLSWHQVVAICKRYVELGLEQADFSEVTRLAADETSKAKGHDYITLVGFGAKAGMLPLHVWLPEAHPAAPSPVSALMSGVMLKTAIYGLLRVCFDLLHLQLWWWGVVLLTLGLVTALFGVVFATAQTDMKRLLAYSSIENIGLILTALGLGLLFKAYDMSVLAALALTACLYHVASHALFKSLLVELGIALDVLVGVLILGVFMFQIREQFDSLDIRNLEKLRED